MTTVNPVAMLRLMNSTPEQLAAQLILRRCDAALEELSAIASVELSDVLAAIHNGDTLTPDQQSRLASYLSAELSTCGMLSLEQLKSCALMTYTTFEMTPAMQASAREIGEALIASGRAKGSAKIVALDAFRDANRRSREQHGDDLHEIVKAAGIAGATGGRA